MGLKDIHIFDISVKMKDNKPTDIQLESHIDGEWWTSEHMVEGHRCTIKMRDHSGCKIHIWNTEETKVIKTFKFVFSTQDFLLNKARNWIKNKL